MSRRTIVLLDVTMMQGDAVCIAGIDVDSGETLRLNNPQPTRSMLRGYGGLAPGDRITVQWRKTLSEEAHVEDGRWEANACIVRVGLTRPFQSGDYEEACWLPVTNILARRRTHFV